MLPPRMYVGRAALIALLPAPATTFAATAALAKFASARGDDPTFLARAQKHTSLWAKSW